MANEIQFGNTSGVILTYGAYQPDGTVRTAAGTSFPEIGSTGYYTADDSNVIAGDMIIVKDSGGVIAQGVYEQAEVVSTLSQTALDDIFNEEVDNDGTVISLKGAMKLILSVLTAESSGGGTTTLVFRDIADSKDRISASVDSNGNRTTINTRDAT